MTKFSLEGKVALITGSSSGIGRGAAVAFAEAGADVALVARREEELARTAQMVEKTGRRSLVIPADITHYARFPDIVEMVAREFGRLDILVNNAGTTRRVAALDMSEDDWDHVMDTNAKSVLFMSQAVAPVMIEGKCGGKIINTASLATDRARENIAGYGASKAAVAQITRTLALELAPHDIQVNAVAPGYIKTDLTEPLSRDEEFSDWVLARVPAGRWGRPEDVAGVMVFLATPAADFITGQVIYADGGWTAKM